MTKLPIFICLLLIIKLHALPTKLINLKRSLGEPIALPALAELSKSNEREEPLKKKTNFSKVVQSLILKKQEVVKPLSYKSSPLGKLKFTHNHSEFYKNVFLVVNPRVIFSPYQFCSDKSDGLYADPLACENFIICYMHQTFRTKCADGTKWNHHTKECDYPVLGKFFYFKKVSRNYSNLFWIVY